MSADLPTCRPAYPPTILLLVYVYVRWRTYWSRPANLRTHPIFILCNVYVGPYKCRPADLPTCPQASSNYRATIERWLRTPTNKLVPTCRPTDPPLIQYSVMYMLAHISADLPTFRLHLLGKMAIELLWIIFLFKCRPADLPTILFTFFVYERAYISKWPLSYYEIYIYI